MFVATFLRTFAVRSSAALLATAALTVACATGGHDGAFDEPADGGVGKDGGTGLPGTDGGKGPTPLPDGGTSGPTTGVFINEVMTARSDSEADVEFVELYNAGATAVTIEGWTLRYKSASNSGAQVRVTFDPGATIGAGAYLVLGTVGYSPKDVTMLPGLGLGGGQLGLLDASSKIVDRVGWGATTSGEYTSGNAAPMAQAGQSIARVDDTGKNDLDFKVATTPTPGAAN